MSVNINSGWTAERPFVLPALQNTYGQGNSGVLKGNSGESWGAKMDGQSFTGYNGEQRNYSAEPNNIKDFFRTGLSANNSIGISGGSEKCKLICHTPTILYRVSCPEITLVDTIST